MKQVFLIFLYVSLCVFLSFQNKSGHRSTTSKNGSVSNLTLLERPFMGTADFTSAIYDCYSLGCRPATTEEVIAWAKVQKNLSYRVYALGADPVIDPAERYVMSLHKTVMTTETVAESAKKLDSAGKIFFLAVKDSAIIAKLYTGQDPAPDF